MPKTILKSVNLTGGISTQPSQVRFPNQVEEATNAAFSVFNGASKRPGTIHMNTPADMPATGTYRMLPIVRDGHKAFVAVFGSEPKVRVFRTEDGDEMPVTISSAAATYLGDQGATADNMRLATVTDHSFIVNTAVPPKAKRSDAYTVNNTYADFDAMVAANPANGTRNRTTGDTPAQPRGYFKVGTNTTGATVPKWTGPSNGRTSSLSYWNNREVVRTVRGYPVYGGNAFRLTVNDGSTNRTVSFFFEDVQSAANMNEVAAILTNSQSPAPATPAEKITVDWSGNRFGIILPAGWTFVGISTADEFPSDTEKVLIVHGSHQDTNEGAAGGAFHFASGTVGTTVLGATGDKTYTRIPPPDQESAVLDATTMPVKLVHMPGDEFTCDLIEWGFRPTGDKNTNPLPSFLEKSIPISDIAYHRDRLVFSADEHVVFSQAGSLYDFFLADDRNIVESDPIDVQISGSRVSPITHIVPFGKRLVFNTSSHQQFELTDAEKLTYETVAVTPSTQIEALPVRPLPIGLSLFILGQTADARQLMEYVYDDLRQGSDASDVGEHVKGIIPLNIRALVGSSNARVILAVEGNGPRILAYSFYWNGNQKQQAAWAEWELSGGAKIHDATAIGTEAYLLVSRGDEVCLERLPMSAFTEEAELPIHADRQALLTGTYENGKTTWTAPAADGKWDTAVLSDVEWGTRRGEVVRLNHLGATLEALGDYSAFPVTACLSFPFVLELSRPFRRDQQGQAIMGEKLTAMRWVVEFRRTGEATLTARDASINKPARTVQFKNNQPVDLRQQAWFGGDVDRMRLRIESTGPRPATVTGWELEAMIGRR